MNNRNIIILFTAIVIVALSCKKNEFYTNEDAKLVFSSDTVMFDTVFTTIGSTTKRLKVYNVYDKTIKISDIFLSGDNTSNYRLNIDGEITSHISNVEILPNDSLYIFVEVTVDPTGEDSPVIIKDSIVFLTNKTIQDVDLVAFGQDVHLINGEIIAGDIWTNDKPYLIYNSMLVDTLQTLIINAGTQVFLHNSSSIIVQGTLIVNGTKDEPVTFQDDRLEEEYDDVPGKWGTIALIPGSTNNKIDYAVIKNGIVGIQAGIYNNGFMPDLLITNSRIENMSYAGLYLFNSSVVAGNCLIDNCGYYAIFMAVNGNNKFYHCTVANYFDYANRTEPSVLISNNITVENTQYTGSMSSYFGNCIIYGSNIEEVGVSKEEQSPLDYLFENCITRISTDNEATYQFDLDNSDNFINIYNNQDPKFKDIPEYDFELDTLSPAKDAGATAISELYYFLNTDFNGESRLTDSAPDLGAFERIEDE